MQLGGLFTELDLLEDSIAKIDAELIDVEFLAHLGEPVALKRRKDLLSARAKSANRVSDVRRGIASGEALVRRLQEAEREAERQQWQAKAGELREEQLAAARRVDAALKELESAHVAYLDAASERGTAVRKAGGQWSNSTIIFHLQRAMHAHCPRMAAHLRLDRAQRINAQSLERMVR